MVDDAIIRLHSQGLATGAIAVRLGVDSSEVRRVVRTHLKAVAEASKPNYNGVSPEEMKRRRKAEAKLAKAQKALEAAAAELANLNSSYGPNKISAGGLNNEATKLPGWVG